MAIILTYIEYITPDTALLEGRFCLKCAVTITITVESNVPESGANSHRIARVIWSATASGSLLSRLRYLNMELSSGTLYASNPLTFANMLRGHLISEAYQQEHITFVL
jgi:hypothetical protein